MRQKLLTFFAAVLCAASMTAQIDAPLTFEAVVAGATVTYNLSAPIQYSTDGVNWSDYSSSITLANVGDKVSFRGNNPSYNNTAPTNPTFQCSDDCYIYGNIMSLVDATNYATATTLTADYTFCYMFYTNTHIKNHSSKDLVLPATTLTGICYHSMFSGCTGLTRTPELPATTLASSCYECMFDNCTGLTSTPVLPATFLPKRYCYRYMFRGCSNLSSVTCYATSRDGANTTTDWLSGVASSGTFYAHINSVFKGQARNASNIPPDWNIVYVFPITANEDPNNLGTYYSTFYDGTNKYELPAGVEAYTTTISGDALNLTKIAQGGQVIPAASAVILKSSIQNYALMLSAESPESEGTNNLLGVDEATSNPRPDYIYVLSAADGEVGFYKLRSDANIPANKAYIDLYGVSSAPRRLRFVFDATTDIESIQPSAVSIQKVLRDGQLIIIRNGVEYNANGQTMK